MIMMRGLSCCRFLIGILGLLSLLTHFKVFALEEKQARSDDEDVLVSNRDIAGMADSHVNPQTRSLQVFDGDCFVSGAELRTAVAAYFEDPAPDAPVALQYGWPIGNWCVGDVRDFSEIFSGELLVGAQTFDEDISGWNTSSAVTMEKMFHQAFLFSQDLDAWNTENVVTMDGMFHRAASFDGAIGSWNVEKVMTAQDMFREALNFNQDVTGWNVSAMENMAGMFQGTLFFNQDLSGWDVSGATNLRRMFMDARDFAQDLCPWGSLLSTDVDVTDMFDGATDCADETDPDNLGTIRPGNFCQLCPGCVIDRTDLRAAVEAYFEDSSPESDIAIILGHPIGTWCVDAVTSFNSIFDAGFNEGAGTFNEDISGWNVANATSMFGMFRNAMLFNQDLTAWDVSRVTNMREMFYDAISFNSDITTWDVSSLENAKDMFRGAIAFNQDISAWDMSNVQNMESMFEAAYEFNQDINAWNVSGVTDMDRTFQETLAFDQPLDLWDVSSVESMRYMFYKSVFSQDISSWNVESVTSMVGMFEQARSFNVDLTPWDVSGVEDFSDMFRLARSFRQDMCPWNTKVSRFARFLGMFSQSGCLIDLTPAFGIFRKGPFCKICNLS